jgi:hypothetical protein
LGAVGRRPTSSFWHKGTSKNGEFGTDCGV